MPKAIKRALIAVVVVVAVMYGASALLTALGQTAAGGGALITGSAIATAAAVTFVSSLVTSAMGAMFNKGGDPSRNNFGTKTTSRQEIAPRQIVYGTCRTGGVIAHIETAGDNNHKLCILSVVAGHPIQGFTSVRFADTELTVTSSTISGETVFRATNSEFINSDNENAFTGGSLIRFTFHDGTQTARDGLAAATLGSTSIPTTHKYINCAYFYFEIIFDSEAMSSIPPISYTLKGKNIYDPRTGAAATTDLQRQNPALQIRDYLTDTVYGMRAESSEINDTTNAGGFAAAANTCDQNVTLADGSSTEKRYKSSGFSTFSASGESVLSGIQSAMAGRITYTNGQFNIFAGAAQTPTLTVTDDDMLAPMQIDTGSGSSKGSLFNQVKAIFVDSSESFKANETPIISDATMLSQDTPSGSSSNNFKKTLETQLPFTTSNTMAQRIAKIQLKYQRKTLTAQVRVGMKYIRLQPNDFVYVTNSRMGWDQKMFEVMSTGMSLDDDGSGALAASINLSLKEISSDVWDFATNEYTTGIGEGSVINTGSFAQAAPTIGSLAQRAVVTGAHTTVDILVNWTNQTGDGVQGTEIQYKLSSESDYVVATVAGKGQTKAVIQNVVVGSTYNVRLRHFSFDNVYSDVSSVANITIAEADTLAAPTSVSATTGKPFFIELKWTNPSNTNLRAVEVHASSTSGFTPSTGTLVNTYYGDVGKSKRVVLGKSSAFGFDYGTTYYFRLRSINALGTTTSYTSEVSGSFTKAASADIDTISANQISAGTIDASSITVDNLDAGNINTGTINVSRLPSAVVFTSELVDGSTVIDGSNIQTGEITLTSGDGSSNLAHIKGGKTSYEDTSNEGFFMGFNSNSHPSFNIGTNTDFLKYDQSNGLVLRGSLVADDIASGGTLSGVNMTIGSSNAIFKATSSGIQLGHATFGSAPFRVTPQGALTATSVTVTGSVTATSGSTGPITTNATKLFLGTGNFNNSDTGFYVDQNGQFSLKDKLSFDGSNLNVNGAITATSLTLGSGISIGSTNLSSSVQTSLALANSSNQDTTSDILAGNHTGTVNGVTASTVTNGAALGATANQDSTSDILAGNHTGSVNGVSASTVTSGAAAGATAVQPNDTGLTLGIQSGAVGPVSVTYQASPLLTKLFQGTGTFNNSNTGFYLDNGGNFSLKDKLAFNGSTLAVNGSITATSLNISGATVTGSLSADHIDIDGTTLDTDSSGNLIVKDSGVDTAQIANNAVTIPTADFTAGLITVNSSQNEVEVQDITFTSTGKNLLIFASVETDPNSGRAHNVTVRVKKNGTTIFTQNKAGGTGASNRAFDFSFSFVDENTTVGTVELTMTVQNNGSSASTHATQSYTFNRALACVEVKK